MNFPSINDMNVDIDSLEEIDVPEGMCLSIQPPILSQEYMRDPVWFDQLGRDPIDQRKIFLLSSREEIKSKLAAVLEMWPRYGPALYEKAAMQGRLDVLKILHELGAESDPKTMKIPNDDEIPLYADIIEHGYLKAIIHGHLDAVKWFVEEGGVPIDYQEIDGDDTSVFTIAYAVSSAQGGPYPEIFEWLIANGAPIVSGRKEAIDDLQAAIQGGNVECVEKILGHEQAISDGITVQTNDLMYAAHSANDDMVRFVLRSACFGIDAPDEGLAGQGTIPLTGLQIAAIHDGVQIATGKGGFDSVRLLLKQLTSVRSDGAFDPFYLPIDDQIKTINAIYDALEAFLDISEVLELLWDCCLHQRPDSNDEEAMKKELPPGEALNRLLATASEHGCVKTVNVLVEKYHTNVNHVSHKFFTVPLARAAGSGRHPVQGRLEVVKYLCSRPEIDMNLGMGEYCNSETALGHAIVQPCHAQNRRKAELGEMVRLLLSLGGPVNVIDPRLRQRCDDAPSDEMIDVHASLLFEEKGRPVRLSIEAGGKFDVVLQYSPRELRAVLCNIKMRSDNATLKANDPRGRPLMPAPGEELPEEERAKPTLLTRSDGVISAA